MHPVSPHKQASVFDIARLVFMQSGAVTHRQKSELVVHDRMEEDSVLYLNSLFPMSE